MSAEPEDDEGDALRRWAEGDLGTCGLAAMVGATIARIERIHYVYQGETNTDTGDLQLTMHDGRVYWLRGAGNGETLQVRQARWEDPFAPPLSPENAEFVRLSGKHTLFHVSEQERLKPLIGQVIHAALPVRDEHGVLRGAHLLVNGQTLTFVIDCDDGWLLEEERMSEEFAAIGLHLDHTL